ncbi:MAG: hypothetical protein MJE77_14170 [Proteobacteria bacterium]|nr:hypothetical protein [Pseudomonadota bacterium]
MKLVKSRREFLRSATILSAAAAVPLTTVNSGCVSGSELSREFIGNIFWQEMAGKLKDEGVYSQGNQGMWGGKAGSHVPGYTKNQDGSIVATTMHKQGPPDDAGHYIVCQFVESTDDGTVFDFRLYTRLDDDNVSTTLYVPEDYTGGLKVYSYCTKHDLWENPVT